MPGTKTMLCVQNVQPLFHKCTPLSAYTYVFICVYMCVCHTYSEVRVQRVKQSAYLGQEFRGPALVPQEPKANFVGFSACMAQTDKSPRGSSQTQSSPAHIAPGNGCLNIRNVIRVSMHVHECVLVGMRKRIYMHVKK